MTTSEKIKRDWVTLKNFSDKHNLNFQMLRNALNGQYNKLTVDTLIKTGYISSREELENKVA